ncbi:hypothetical protein L6R53_12450 [Myxococcota bacterium]|nr:hypothetical protein [Myxococcota bacterium]
MSGVAFHLSVPRLPSPLPPHPLDLDRQWRLVVGGLAGAGPLSVALHPDGLELLVLCGPASHPAVLRRMEAALPGLQGDGAGVEALPAHRVAGTARWIEGPLPHRWSTGWERAGLRWMSGAGAADLRALLPQAGHVAPVSLDSRQYPAESLPTLTQVAALALGLHPQELRLPASNEARAARRLAAALCRARGWAEPVLYAHLGADALVGPVAPGAQRAALRLLAAVIGGRVRLDRSPGLEDLAIGRRASPTAGSPGARLARRVAART